MMAWGVLACVLGEFISIAGERWRDHFIRWLNYTRPKRGGCG